MNMCYFIFGLGENDCRFFFCISKVDEEYFKWKVVLLKEILVMNFVYLGVSNKFLF